MNDEWVYWMMLCDMFQDETGYEALTMMMPDLTTDKLWSKSGSGSGSRSGSKYTTVSYSRSRSRYWCPGSRSCPYS